MVRSAGRIIKQFGRSIGIHQPDGVLVSTVSAFFQAVPERKQRGQQHLPHETGIIHTDRFVCLASPDAPLDSIADAYISCEDTLYRILSVQEVWHGNKRSHWRMVLTTKGEMDL